MSNQDPTAPDYGSGDRPNYPPPPPPTPSSTPYPSPGVNIPPPPGSATPYPPPPGAAPSYPTTPPASYPPPADTSYGAPQMGYPSANPYAAQTGPMSLPGGRPVPSMGTRLLARIIDGVIFGVVWGVFSAMTIGGLSATADADGQVSGFGVAAMFTSFSILALFGLAYEVVLIALRGATIGKQLMGIKVVQVDSGALPGWGPSVIRWGVPLLGGLLCGIGQLVIYLSPFWADPTGRQRGYHDQAAKTVVVSSR